MINRTALAVKAAGTRSWWETGKLWGHLKKRTALTANAAVIVPLVAVGFWVYLVQERSIGKLRRTNESLSEQIAKKGQRRVREAETARSALTGTLPQSQKKAQAGTSR